MGPSRAEHGGELSVGPLADLRDLPGIELDVDTRPLVKGHVAIDEVEAHVHAVCLERLRHRTDDGILILSAMDFHERLGVGDFF